MDRESQIYIGELIAALSAILSLRRLLKGRRILHFVDNQGALASLIAGVAADPDTAAIARLSQLLLASIGSSVWLEFVAPGANIADLPSRPEEDWLSSPLRKQLGCTLTAAALPELHRLCLAPIFPSGTFDLMRELVP